jgi:hypothetical protein
MKQIRLMHLKPHDRLGRSAHEPMGAGRNQAQDRLDVSLRRSRRGHHFVQDRKNIGKVLLTPYRSS